MLSSRLLPANTPRQRLSMARSATLRVRLGLRGQGINCTNFPDPLLVRDVRASIVLTRRNSGYNRWMEGSEGLHLNSEFGGYWV